MTFMGKHKEFLHGDGTVLYPNRGVNATGSTHVVQFHDHAVSRFIQGFFGLN